MIVLVLAGLVGLTVFVLVAGVGLFWPSARDQSYTYLPADPVGTHQVAGRVRRSVDPDYPLVPSHLEDAGVEVPTLGGRGPYV